MLLAVHPFVSHANGEAAKDLDYWLMASVSYRLSEVHNHVYAQTDSDFVQACPSHQSIEASCKSTPASQRQKICSSGGARKATAKSSPMQAKVLPQSESKLPALFLSGLILQEKG